MTQTKIKEIQFSDIAKRYLKLESKLEKKYSIESLDNNIKLNVYI